MIKKTKHSTHELLQNRPGFKMVVYQRISWAGVQMRLLQLKQRQKNKEIKIKRGNHTDSIARAFEEKQHLQFIK